MTRQKRNGASALARQIRDEHPGITPGQVHAMLRDDHGLDVSKQAVAQAMAREGGMELTGRRVPPYEAKRRERAHVRKIEGKVARRRRAVLATPPGKMALGRRNALTLVSLLLRARDGLTAEQLLEEIGCSRATLYRYRDDVIAAGIDLLTDGSPAVWRLVVKP
jgi:hypothetical protein